MNGLTSYVTLDSQDGCPTSEAGVLRFPIDSVFRNVSEVEWLTMEVQSNHALTIDAASSTLYFTEDLKFFKAQLPYGHYTCQSLCKAIEAAMCCATDVLVPESEGPRNAYSVRMLGDSSRLSISSSSDGGVPFAVHTYQALMKIRSLRRFGTEGTTQITVVHHETEPMARGSVLQVFRPAMLPVMVQVIRAVGNVLLVRPVGGEVFDQDVNGEDEGWSLKAICQDTSLPDLLGLGTKDLRSSQPIHVVSSSSPLLGTAATALSERAMHVGLACPHGCVEGDVVSLDGFEGGFVNGQQARVLTVVSEQQLVVQVDVSHMGSFSTDQPLCVSVHGKEYAFRVPRAMAAHAQQNVLCVRMSVDRADMEKLESLKALHAEWLPAKMLPPVPCREWLGGHVTLKVDTATLPSSLMMRCPYHHLSSPNACIKRNAVVGLKKMRLLHKKSVLLMRLRLGMTEAYGVVSLKDNNRNVFGRAQMKDGGFLASSDHSLVGRAHFDPPLERVPFLEVAFVTPQGCVVQPNVLGEYSLLLRLRGSS